MKETTFEISGGMYPLSEEGLTAFAKENMVGRDVTCEGIPGVTGHGRVVDVEVFDDLRVHIDVEFDNGVVGSVDVYP